MAAREKRIFTGMEADRNEGAAECSLYQGQERLKSRSCPFGICCRRKRVWSEKYCNIAAILYNMVLGANGICPVCCRSDLYDMQNMYQE